MQDSQSNIMNDIQKDEIEALESIYTPEEFSYQQIENQYRCSFKIFISLPDDYFFSYKDTRDPSAIDEMVKISHLPPLLLTATLPADYPAVSAPEFTLSCSWLRLGAITKLCKKLDGLWCENQGQEVLFTWVTFLQNDTLEFLNIERSVSIDHAYTLYKMNSEKIQNEATDGQLPEISEAKNSRSIQKRAHRRNKYKLRNDRRAIVEQNHSKNQSYKNPIHYLLDYNEKRLIIEFKKRFYTCNICLLDKSGESCTQFKPCLHVFCKECIASFLEVRIKDGAVQDIYCPEDKCKSEIGLEQIKNLVSPELFAQYDSKLLNTTLDTMLDGIYCPRKDCQYPACKEPDGNMATCPNCRYAFCALCRMGYHGVEPCRYNSGEKEKIVNVYLNGTADEKLALETRFGTKQLRTLVENAMSETWISDNSRNCPHCDAAIEKSDGCNKMTCGRCKTYFCWICRVKLSKETPYSHFQNPRSPCYRMLYHGLIEDDSDDDEGLFIGGSDDSDDEYYDDII